MGWRDLCDWRHSFPRTKLLPKAGVRFIRYTRGETGPLDGAWRRDASHTLATKRPLPSSYKMAWAPILGVFFLSIAPFLPLFSPPFLLPLFVHKQLRTCSFLCILSSILFSLPFKPPNMPPSFYSVSFPFPSFRLLLSSSSRSPPRGVLYPLHFPSLSFSRLVRCVSTFLRSLRARDSFPTCEFPSCNIVYIIERIEEYAYLVFDMRGGTLEIASVQSFSPFLFFFIIRKVHTHTNYRLDVRSVISVAKGK